MSSDAPQGAAGSPQDTCVFVCSSENTWDVFERVAPSLLKWWPGCPYPKFVGTSKSCAGSPLLEEFSPLYAEPGGWRSELRAQVCQLPAQVEWIVLFLDDFLLYRPVDQNRVAELLRIAKQSEADYLRFIPHPRSLVGTVLKFLSGSREDDLERIDGAKPYPSSLQVSLWRRTHLVEMLQGDGSIWNFEREWLNGVKHFCIRSGSPVPYRHVVERGRWFWHAPMLFRRAGVAYEPGDRPGWGIMRTLRWYLNRLKFLIIGYAWMMLRRRLQQGT